METYVAIIIVLEFLLMVGCVIGFMFEKRIMKWERKQARKIKRAIKIIMGAE